MEKNNNEKDFIIISPSKGDIITHLTNLMDNTVSNINMSLTNLNCILENGIDIKLNDDEWVHIEPNKITFDFSRKHIIFYDIFRKSKSTGKFVNHVVNFEDDGKTWRTIWLKQNEIDNGGKTCDKEKNLKN